MVPPSDRSARAARVGRDTRRVEMIAEREDLAKRAAVHEIEIERAAIAAQRRLPHLVVRRLAIRLDARIAVARDGASLGIGFESTDSCVHRAAMMPTRSRGPDDIAEISG